MSPFAISAALQRRRARKLRLRGLKSSVRELVAQDEELTRQYRNKRMVRLWAALSKVLLGGAVFLGIVATLFGGIVFGLFLLGTIDVTLWIFAGKAAEFLEIRMLGGWSVLSFLAVLAVALRIRHRPVGEAYLPWGANLPVEDRMLIGPKDNFFIYCGCLGIISCTAFVVCAFAANWPILQTLSTLLMVALTCLGGWVMSEALACLLTSTPLVQISTGTTIAIGFILVFAACTVKDKAILNELQNLSLYESIWRLPPGGWLISLTGQLPFSYERNVILPSMFVLLLIGCFWVYQKTLELEDIQFGGGQRLVAFRKFWVRSWSVPQPKGILRRYTENPSGALPHITKHRRSKLGIAREGIPIWSPFRLGEREHAILGLLGLHFARRGRLSEMFPTIWPILMAIGLIVINQYMTLVALPKFLRIPLVAAFAVSLIELREIGASSHKADVQLGFSIARAVFPISLWEIWRALLRNRFLLAWMLMPGWALAIGLLLMTDIPRSMIFQPPLMFLVLSFLSTAPTVLNYAICNLSSTWKSWLLLQIPVWFLSIMSSVIAFACIGGYLLAMRPDAAWMFVIGLGVLHVPITLFLCHRLSKGWMDQTVVPLQQALKR